MDGPHISEDLAVPVDAERREREVLALKKATRSANRLQAILLVMIVVLAGAGFLSVRGLDQVQSRVGDAEKASDARMTALTGRLNKLARDLKVQSELLERALAAAPSASDADTAMARAKEALDQLAVRTASASEQIHTVSTRDLVAISTAAVSLRSGLDAAQSRLTAEDGLSARIDALGKALEDAEKSVAAMRKRANNLAKRAKRRTKKDDDTALDNALERVTP